MFRTKTPAPFVNYGESEPCCRPSSTQIKATGHIESSKSTDDEIRARNVEIFIERFENGLDLWTGEKLN